MRLYLTYCSGQKDESLISSGERVPPGRLYTSQRIQKFIEGCTNQKAYWAIFSDKYGIWFPNEVHEWYEKHPDDVTNAEFVRLVLQSVNKLRKYDVFFYADKNDPKFHPLYKQLIDELRARCIPVTIFDNLSQITQDQSVITYQPSDKILFLTICSFGKSTEGFPPIPGPCSFTERVNTDFSNQIVLRRRTVLNFLKKGKIIFNQADQKNHDFNAQLLNGTGMEFGGQDSSYYLPALWRYDGRFYVGLGSHGKKGIFTSPHHFLILSGLYGIVTPDELIQCYSVPLYEGDPVQKVWTEGKFLTKALSDYLTKHNILRIFDFTGIQYYRDLLDWKYLKKMNPEVDVLHAFSTQGGGENALRPFGKLIGDELLLLKEEELLAITPEKQYDEVYFRAIYQPWPDKPGDSKLPSDANILDLNYITDLDSQNILKSAEHETTRCVNSAYNPEDAGSTILWHYSKGLERMMHHICAVRVRRYLLRKYKNENEIMKALPYRDLTLKSLALASKDSNEYQLMLGDWIHLQENLQKAAPNLIAKDIQKFLTTEYGSNFNILVRVCSILKDYRNPATHRKIYPLDQALVIRNKIVVQLNDVIHTFYRNRIWIEKLAKSTDLVDRINAIKSLQIISENWCVENLIELLNDPTPVGRRESAEALGAIGNPKALAPLKSHDNDPDKGVRFSVKAAIRKIEEENQKTPLSPQSFHQPFS